MIMDERVVEIQACMYQYSRALYRAIKDLTDPYVNPSAQLEYRRDVLASCEQTMERLATDPHYFANPDKALWPNAFVKARVQLETLKGALVVPAAAVQRGPNGTFAYVVGPSGARIELVQR